MDAAAPVPLDQRTQQSGRPKRIEGRINTPADHFVRVQSPQRPQRQVRVCHTRLREWATGPALFVDGLDEAVGRERGSERMQLGMSRQIIR